MKKKIILYHMELILSLNFYHFEFYLIILLCPKYLESAEIAQYFCPSVLKKDPKA
jgi:hypothetical protein